MGTDAALMLAQSLKVHEREDAATSGLAKKVRVEETDPTVFHPDHLGAVLRHTFDCECFPVCVIV